MNWLSVKEVVNYNLQEGVVQVLENLGIEQDDHRMGRDTVLKLWKEKNQVVAAAFSLVYLNVPYSTDLNSVQRYQNRSLNTT